MKNKSKSKQKKIPRYKISKLPKKICEYEPVLYRFDLLDDKFVFLEVCLN